MKQIIKYYVFSYWHIAICALVLYIGSTKYFLGFIDQWLAIHVFCATSLVYCCHRLFSSSKMNIHGQQRYSFVEIHRGFFLTVISISLLLTVISFVMLSRPVQLTLFCSGCVSLGYILPLVLKKRLRDIGVSKIFLISLVWATLPLLSIIHTGDVLLLSLLFAEHFFFIFALTIPFDIRDKELDNKASVSNLANILDIRQLRLVIILSVSLAALAAVALYGLGYYHIKLLYWVIALLGVQLIVTIQLSDHKSEMFYLFFLDSFILLKGSLYLYNLMP